MNDTIIALLNNNLRVIIPDFGAFIIRQKQPRIIVFNEFLRYNDGILIDFIVKTEGIDRDIAEQRVMDFAEDGTKLLASGRELVIEGLGSLRKDSSGKINFIEAPEISEIDKKSPVETEFIVEEEKNRDDHPVVEQKTPKKDKAKSTTVKKGNPAKATAKVKTKPVALETAAEPVAIETPAAGPEALEEAIAPAAVESAPDQPVAALTQEAVDNAVAEFRPVMEPAPPVRTPPPPEEKPLTSVPVSTNRILAWVLIILFVNVVILGWFVFRKKTHDKFTAKSEPALISDTLYDQLADSVRSAARDTSIVYTENPEKIDYSKVNAESPGSRYYIVAGCFRDEVNADLLVSSLKHLGYKAEKFGKIGNLFAVCFASFDNKEEAVPELKKIREKVPSAWMTKF